METTDKNHDRPAGGRAVPGSAPLPSHEQDPAPEATNRSHPETHPGRPGSAITVPGAGILRAGADAGPREGDPALTGDQPYPGQPACDSPVTAPNARPSRGAGTRLNPPTDQLGPGGDRDLPPDAAPSPRVP